MRLNWLTLTKRERGFSLWRREDFWVLLVGHRLHQVVLRMACRVWSGVCRVVLSWPCFLSCPFRRGGVGGPVVWAGVPHPPVVDAEPVLSEGSDCAGEFPDDVAACAVARALEADHAESRSCPVLPGLPSFLPRADLIEARRDDEE